MQQQYIFVFSDLLVRNYTPQYFTNDKQHNNTQSQFVTIEMPIN